jgi:two-component system chemotaxis sensor kinase CheA
MVQVPAARLRSMLLQIEALRAPKLGLDEHLVSLREIEVGLSIALNEYSALQSKFRAIYRNLERESKTDEGEGETRRRANFEVAHLLGQFERCGKKADSLADKLTSVLRLAEKDHRTLSGVSASLLEDTRELSMAPFASAFEALPKLVRDLAQSCGKEIELMVPRSGIHADRRILAELKNPLIHILRNCVDHGIELPSDRELKGKPRKGTISISILPKDGGKVEISIADNGAGINVEKVRAAAGIGLPGQSASLTDEEALQLVFQSGLSTSFMVTNLSGRGLGLAIAREKVEKLGGSLTVESQRGSGTKFRITVPLTLATLRGVLVRSGESQFVIPTAHVERVILFKAGDIKTIENRETISFEGKAVSLARLYDVLSIKPDSSSDDEKLQVLVLHAAGERIAFLVDEILSEQEVIAKPLDRQLSRVGNLAGTTVLGTGKMVPIINVHELMKSAARSRRGPAGPEIAAVRKRRSVLIAEDSITSRTLMKNILESAGYEVKTAVDGLDAFTALKEMSCDLVVSDVEMPRMTGFDLTAKIRADQRLAATPVVLVTALDSREDRERGLDVGANAYIVKGSLDQSDLLQTIQRLI